MKKLHARTHTVSAARLSFARFDAQNEALIKQHDQSDKERFKFHYVTRI